MDKNIVTAADLSKRTSANESLENTASLKSADLMTQHSANVI